MSILKDQKVTEEVIKILNLELEGDLDYILIKSFIV